HLGRGFHNMPTPNEWRWDQAPWRGPVRARAHMEVTCTDESTVSVTTGDGWRTRPGPVTFDSMYEGETFSPSEDPRAWMLPGYDDADWAKARTATDAGSPLLQRSEEHTSELQSRFDLVCRLLLAKKK